MPAWGWIPIGIAVVIVALIVLLVVRRRNTSMLRQQFGGEYDRTVSQSGSRRTGEAQLRSRQRMRAEAEVKPLPEASRAQYVDEWHVIQERFVDRPSSAVSAADELVGVVMKQRGYPVDDFDTQADVVSVDHPDLVDNYRVAHGVNERNKLGRATTEELRDALVRYRSLFQELLGADDDVTMPRTSTGGEDPAGPHQSQDRAGRHQNSV